MKFIFKLLLLIMTFTFVSSCQEEDPTPDEEFDFRDDPNDPDDIYYPYNVIEEEESKTSN
ncbi:MULTISPECIES: hypothetical protein [Flammeovirga]|uniref:Secreted protein n=1 Tax=Flammeovirga agarivorans TaxID=2726742 RepID=A0A7X8XYE6_9BACT|nr:MULTISPECIES: hypothetical protein [Flammeovirga]NLR94144.1 hypothetical protein [Flammeovirga agarivorans]